MASVKEELHALIDRLPDDATYDDARYAIYVRREIELGLQEIDRGELIPHEEVEARILGWPIE